MKVSALSRTSLGTTACTRGSAPFRSSGKKCCHRRPRLAANLCECNSVRPSHLFGHYFDHDYYFELPCGSGAPNQFDGDLRHTMTQFRATPRANRTSKSADNPIPYATSSTAELTVCGPSLPWRWHGHAASRGAETDAARLAHLVCRLVLDKKDRICTGFVLRAVIGALSPAVDRGCLRIGARAAVDSAWHRDRH